MDMMQNLGGEEIAGEKRFLVPTPTPTRPEGIPGINFLYAAARGICLYTRSHLCVSPNDYLVGHLHLAVYRQQVDRDISWKVEAHKAALSISPAV